MAEWRTLGEHPKQERIDWPSFFVGVYAGWAIAAFSYFFS
jgi:hypothetical protein